MNKTIIAIAGLIIFVVVIGFFALHMFAPVTSPAVASASTQTISTTDQQTATADSSTAGSQQYSLVDVAQHSDQHSCWTAINGKVYDLTKWIFQHPGGPGRILSICGSDGSAAFNAQHGGQRRPANELQSFYIGDLKQ